MGAPKTGTYVPQAEPPIQPVLPPVMLDLPPFPSSQRYNQALAYYSTDGLSYLRDCLERSRPYRDFIHHQLTKYGVPDEIFWLAALESGFSNTAVSDSGAVGMWQFMRNSIDGYDMEITPYIDQRKDFWNATIGAARKLRDNYNYLGDWYLALAAYNAGIPRVEGAIRRSGGIRNYWILSDKGYLPRETANYVPQLLAMATILEQKTRYGLPLDWGASEKWDRIRVERPVDLRLLAEAAKVPYSDLSRANPELRYPITPAGMRDYRLKVPASWAAPVRKALDDPQLKLIRYYFYKVQGGDTLLALADWYGVTTSMIEKTNPRLRPRYLQIGQIIVIPALKDVRPYHRVEVAQKPLGPVHAIPGVTYVVKKGDTLYGIAHHHGTTPELLAAVNSLNPDSVLSIGRALLMPEGAAVAR
jgi:membrane-bound lytic murein transglycosylase D